MFLVSCATEPEADVTAYVLAYHWGFAVFDADGRELDRLEVPVGSTVRVVAVNDHAGAAIARLPREVASTIRLTDWNERAHIDVAEGRIRDPAEFGMSLQRELDLSHAHDTSSGPAHVHWTEFPGAAPGFTDHGLEIVGYGVRIDRLDAYAERPKSVFFTADRAGRFVFECVVKCGFGHSHPRELFVVR